MTVYDHYIKNKQSPDSNNDAYGHGTHVAGILGGGSVGVAPKANVYGVKILDNRGGGTDSTVLAGLLFVADWIDAERERTGKQAPAVVCMSLGGSCLFPGCENEIMVDMLGNFTAKGIHMVVAAGNE
jgi:cerevisin